MGIIIWEKARIRGHITENAIVIVIVMAASHLDSQIMDKL